MVDILGKSCYVLVMSARSVNDAPAPSSDALVAAFWSLPNGLYTTETLLHRIEDRLRNRGHRVVLNRVDDLRALSGAIAYDALDILKTSGLQVRIDSSVAANLLAGE
jgi:hypothetical protein